MQNAIPNFHNKYLDEYELGIQVAGIDYKKPSANGQNDIPNFHNKYLDEYELCTLMSMLPVNPLDKPATRVLFTHNSFSV